MYGLFYWLLFKRNVQIDNTTQHHAVSICKIWYMTCMFSEDLMHCDIHCINFSNWPNSSCTNSFLLAYTKSSVQYPWSSIIWHFQHTCIAPSISTIPLSLISTPTVHHTFTFVICICAPTQLHVYSSIKVSKIALIRYICLSNYTEPIKWNIQNN